jgi:two-component system chemotaxis response regulator CheY
MVLKDDTMIKLDDDLAQTYLAESAEHLAAMEKDLLALELGGEEVDENLVNRIFRAVHSIKGGAGFFDLDKVRELAHQTEHAMALIRAGEMPPTPNRISVLLHATDRLRALLQNPGSSNQADISGIEAALAGLPGLGAVVRDYAGPTPRLGGGPLRTLLVEDDFSSRLLLQTFLGRYGECHVAVNGREAVEAFRFALERGLRYDLICMDIMMPEMDGREAVRQLRDMEEGQGILSTYGTKIVMTTAVNDLKEVVRCFQELCDAYLVKPIDLGELLNKMRSYQLVE